MSGKPSSYTRRSVPFLTLALLLSVFMATVEAAPPIPDGDTAALRAAIIAAKPGATITLTKDSTYNPMSLS